MLLFSKRNKPNNEFQYRDRFTQGSKSHIPVRFIKKRQELLNEEARNRIISQIQFLSNSNIFFEPYILMEDKQNKIFTLNGSLLDNFSLSELGYKFSSFFNFRKMEFYGAKTIDNEEETTIIIYDDYKLFDLIEAIILFSKADKRNEIILRINNIMLEEDINWKIIKHLITKNDGDKLNDITNQIKDDKLKNKLKSYFSFLEEEDYINCAKISSDILNIIFSDFLQNNKKQKIETIKNNIVDLIVENKENTQERKDEMKGYIQDLLISSKNLSNQIFDIRHSEKSTIKIKNPYIYELISRNNISLIEFVLTTLKDEFIISEEWEKIKSEYIEKYNINKDAICFYPEIDIDDIPF